MFRTLSEFKKRKLLCYDVILISINFSFCSSITKYTYVMSTSRTRSMYIHFICVCGISRLFNSTEVKVLSPYSLETKVRSKLIINDL